MTIIEAVSLVDDRKHNTFTQEDKVSWLSRLDGEIGAVLRYRYETPLPTAWPYDLSTDVETPLLVGPPFDSLYLYYLEMQIDYHSGDYGRYNNARALYLAALERYLCNYHRTHRCVLGGDFQ